MNGSRGGDRPDPRLLLGVLATMGDAVYIADTDGRITFVNRAFDSLYGMEGTTLVGQSVTVLGPGAMGTGAASGDDHTGTEVIHLGRGGREIPVLLRRATVCDDAGRVMGWVHVVRDLTESRRQSAALERAQAEIAAQKAALTELAIRDDLTGLFNQKEMHRLLTEEVGRCRRSRRPLSLLRLEIDGFKTIGAKHGDKVTSEILRAVAQLLRSNLRPIDRPARYGEELAIILPDTFANDAVQVAERLRGTVGAMAFPVADAAAAATLKVTLSVGVAGFHESEQGSEQLIKVAGQALNEARGRGHNCVVAFVDLSSSKTH